MVLWVSEMKVAQISQKCINFLRTKTFFYIIVGIFCFSALWLAFTSRYPMAFDENYHYGIIQQYAKQWSPFFNSPPPGSESLGDITRYPSYLFHYLMSFPYRLISLVTNSEPVKIMFLRILNIAMLASSFWLFKKIFEKAKLSRALGNVVLFIFTLVPVVPFLGAQISYDNASIPLTALTVLLLIKIIGSLRQKKPSTNLIIFFGILGIFSSLIKYTYLPIFAVASLYLLVALIYYGSKYKLTLFKTTAKNFRALTGLQRIALATVLILALGLFIERYGVNMAVYRTPVPDCGQILSESSCKQYGPWGRDLRLKQRRDHDVPQWKIKDYNKIWFRTTMNEFFFAIDHNYTPKPPLPVLFGFSQFMLRVGLVVSLLFSWKILKNRQLRLFLILFVVYTAIVWIDNFMKFYVVHWPVAIHGRYLLPLLPLMFIVLSYGMKYLLDYIPKYKDSLKLATAAVCMAVMLWGGGALTYIVRSDDSWYWQNSLVTSSNHAVKRVFDPLLR